MSSTEAPFSFTTKINGDLFTVRGVDAADFARNLEWATDKIAEIVTRVGTIQAAGHATPAVNTQAPAPAPAATPSQWNAPSPPPTAPAGDAPLCEHGIPAKLIPAGISKKTGKPYRAFYACSMPQGSQCNTRVSV
jgi:hypothetical protein